MDKALLKESLDLIQNSSGTITPYGVVHDSGMELEQVYNGRQFPRYSYEKRLIMIGITPQKGCLPTQKYGANLMNCRERC